MTEKNDLSQKLDNELIYKIKEAKKQITAELSKIIIGQNEVIEQIIVSLFSCGHCLLVGVPGLAKTLMVRTLAKTINLEFKRIQFTPDLMPSDITGTNILEEDAQRVRNFKFHKGPLFANIILADEINRTPPKTQAALLEAMQEQKVTVSGFSYDLPKPFLVLATQNPIEQEGTYPLPEAQLDRFMFCILINYPTKEEEEQILLDTTKDVCENINCVIDGETIIKLQNLVRQVPVSKHVVSYTTSLIRSTRPEMAESPDFVKRWARWGAGTRAGQYLILAAKTHVLLSGRENFSVSCSDIKKFALPVLRHRIFCNFVASSEGITTDAFITKLIKEI